MSRPNQPDEHILKETISLIKLAGIKLACMANNANLLSFRRKQSRQNKEEPIKFNSKKKLQQNNQLERTQFDN